MKPRLLEMYQKEIADKLAKKFQYKNKMEIPKMTKIVVNMGIGAAVSDSSLLEKAQEELATITGQKPAITTAKKSISNFKLREGAKIGCKVTLRGARMYEFFDRLVNITLPRIRDFRGINPNSFDQGGNFSMGIQEQSIFPEIEFDKIQRSQGMGITIATTAKTKEEARELLWLMGMPFKGMSRQSDNE